MNNRVLKTILESKSDYFIVESYYSWYDGIWKQNKEERKLVLISLPEVLNKIRREKNMETVTVKEMEMFKESYIEQNIFIFPKYAPFQQYQKIFYHATDCMPLEEFELTEFLSANLKTICDVKKLLETGTTTA